jgi:hypothetical protein
LKKRPGGSSIGRPKHANGTCHAYRDGIRQQDDAWGPHQGAELSLFDHLIGGPDGATATPNAMAVFRL